MTESFGGNGGRTQVNSKDQNLLYREKKNLLTGGSNSDAALNEDSEPHTLPTSYSGPLPDPYPGALHLGPFEGVLQHGPVEVLVHKVSVLLQPLVQVLVHCYGRAERERLSRLRHLQTSRTANEREGEREVGEGRERGGREGEREGGERGGERGGRERERERER